MRQKDIKKVMNAVFLIVVFGLTVWSVFGGEDLKEIGSYLLTADFRYICPAVFCVVLFIMGEATVIEYLLRSLGTRVRFSHCCLYSFTGFFYSCITPSASGGQPMQVIAMRRDKIPVAVSTVVLAIVTITYKLVLVVIGLCVVLIRPPVIMACMDSVEALVHLGLVLNIGCITLLLLLVFHPDMVRGCTERVLVLINRIRPLKRPEKMASRLDRTVNQYTGTAEFYRMHKGLIVVVFLITLVQRIALFMVTWFTYRAFGLQGESFFTIILLQAMISVAVDMLPLPGGMGISENLFLKMFLPVFGSELVLPGMVISRGISYYTQLLLSAVATAVASLMLRPKE